ncbi:MAG: cupin domain-containing protein [Pseudomonadota bacterium]
MPLSPSLRERLVRYDELRPCTNAFIDARSPGSDKKENFTIIGPGVAENPHQYVHITEPHGFNIGAARQPPGCTNSLHSHTTAEVFIIHTGRWRFFWGEHGDAGEVFLVPGDTISIPTNVFRGFENVGEDVGFMFAVLGGDDPGRVHWAPHVIEKAAGYGLVLLESGRLIDTTEGEQIPAGAAVVHPSAPSEIAHIRTPLAAEMAVNVAHCAALRPLASAVLGSAAIRESVIIANSADDRAQAQIDPVHQFGVRKFDFNAGAATATYTRSGAEVLLVQSGELSWTNDAGAETTLAAGDTFTVPAGMQRKLRALTNAELFIVATDPVSVVSASAA